MITRTIIIRNTSKKLGITIKLTRSVVNDFLRQINGALLQGEVIWVRDFGVFKIVNCKSRKAMNVKRGLPIIVPAKKRIRFKPCATMKAAINAK